MSRKMRLSVAEQMSLDDSAPLPTPNRTRIATTVRVRSKWWLDCVRCGVRCKTERGMSNGLCRKCFYECERDEAAMVADDG